MFSGASQYAFVALATNGVAAAATAALLGARNALYGLRHVGRAARCAGLRHFVAAQIVIDESTAMAIGREKDGEPASRLAFWATGTAIYVLWNSLTLVGAVAAGALPDPRKFGLDAVAPAAFLALLAPRLRGRGPLGHRRGRRRHRPRADAVRSRRGAGARRGRCCRGVARRSGGERHELGGGAGRVGQLLPAEAGGTVRPGALARGSSASSGWRPRCRSRCWPRSSGCRPGRPATTW